MSNQRMMYLVNKDNPDAMNLAKKLVGHSHLEGAVIPCSKGEIDCYSSDDFKAISLNDVTTSLVLVTPGANYILFANEETYLDDVAPSAKYLGISIGIIRNENA